MNYTETKRFADKRQERISEIGANVAASATAEEIADAAMEAFEVLLAFGAVLKDQYAAALLLLQRAVDDHGDDATLLEDMVEFLS